VATRRNPGSFAIKMWKGNRLTPAWPRPIGAWASYWLNETPGALVPNQGLKSPC